MSVGIFSLRWRYAFLFSVLTAVSTVATAQETISGWHPNLEEAQRQAEMTGKPLFITFRCVR